MAPTTPTKPAQTAIDSLTDWPARAIKTRDCPDEVIRVMDGSKLRERILSGVDPERAIWAAMSAVIYLRHTDSTTYAVTLHDGQAYYGTAGGYGYDRTAAALSQHPVGTVDGHAVILTDHCGLDRHSSPWGGMRSILAHKGSSRDLPGELFTL